MLDWSRIKFGLAAAALAALPLAFFLLARKFLPELAPATAPISPWALQAAAAGLGLIAAFAGGWLWHRSHYARVDLLIEHCHRLALANPQTLSEGPGDLGRLGRLGLAIEVLREVLVDYLSLYRRFFEAAPDMFISLSPAGGRILDANQAFCRAVGLLRSEVLGQKADRFVELEKPWDAAPRQNGTLAPGRVLTPGAAIKVEASLSWEQGPQGQPWVIGAILRDVSQRESLHRQLLQKSTALEKALEEIRSVEELKDQFLTTLSHELKTPMVAIKGFMQLLMRGDVPEEEAKRFLEICWRNLAKLEKQINDLLDLARLSQNKEQFEMGPVELATLVRTEAENLRPMAGEKKVRFSRLPAQSAVVVGNAEKLVQLVDNLLINAVKYNKEGGEVRVDIEALTNEVILTVSDSGLGMDREHIAQIFNRFYRADLSGTGRIEGLGIGLSLVQEIVRLHGGDIKVRSAEGEGTTFTVSLRPHTEAS